MLILASGSPRRKELLKSIYNKEFKIVPADIDEHAIKSDSVLTLAEDISNAKAAAVSKLYPNDLVLAADTVVIYNEKVFGKPANVEEAKKMLKALNEVEHKVITGYHFYKNGKDLLSNSVSTTLVLHNLTDENITKYILTGSPFDKAGGYGVQDDEIKYTIKNGPYDNVMGFPTEIIRSNLKQLGI